MFVRGNLDDMWMTILSSRMSGCEKCKLEDFCQPINSLDFIVNRQSCPGGFVSLAIHFRGNPYAFDTLISH